MQEFGFEEDKIELVYYLIGHSPLSRWSFEGHGGIMEADVSTK